MATFSNKLIVLSNRGPYTKRRGRLEKAAGGLVSAIDPIMQENGGVWIAAGSGEKDGALGGRYSKMQVPSDNPRYVQKSVWLTSADEDNYYNGYSNRFLWPLCHMILDKIYLRSAYWTAYKKVNELFVKAVLEEMEDKSAIIWLQDYHMALCAKGIRDAKPKTMVLHFWHIPWPPHDIFRICPQRKEILEGLLANDLIGFQLDSFCRNFMGCVDTELGAGIDLKEGYVHYRGHATRVKAFPISVDFKWFTDTASAAGSERVWARFKKALHLTADGFIGVGVDRMEYTKGLLKRLEALNLFFSKYPRYRRRFTFIQVAVPTRNVEPYTSYKKLVEGLVSSINAKYRDDNWEPIKYVNYKLDHEELAVIYRKADLAIISSVYDGMNLVAKEFVASQVDRRGSLLLSEFAGAADEIPGAILINPYDTEGFADAIKNAIEMPPLEKQRLIGEARTYIEENDIFKWVEAIQVEALKLG